MNLKFIQQINDYVIEANMEATEEEILLSIGESGHPSWEDIKAAHSFITQAVNNKRQQRLEQKKSEFLAYSIEQENALKIITANKAVPEMLLDIVRAIQNTDKVPNGILLAFREQGQNGTDDDIKKIWQNLVELGLIDQNENDQ